MKRNILTMIALTTFSGTVLAQTKGDKAPSATEQYKTEASAIVSDFADNMRALSSNASKLTNAEETASEASLTPYIYQLISPGIYYSSAVEDKFTLEYATPDSRDAEAVASPGMEYREALANEVNSTLAASYLNAPNSFHYTDEQIQQEQIVSPAKVAQTKVEDLSSIYNQVTEIADVKDVVADVDVDLAIEKPNFWTRTGKFSLQFTQNYLSTNWYKGGNNNVTMLSNLLYEANYNDQKKVQWDNKLDMRLGFVSTTNDKYRKYMPSNDKIALYSKLGIKATKAWFYTLSAEANSQFMPGYRNNNPEKFSNFLSPLDAFISLGMDFKPTLPNKNTLSVELLPFSYKMRYIDSNLQNIHKSYNQPRHFHQDFGSKFVVNTTLHLAKDLTWRSRVYYFTSYQYTEGEFENNFNYQFNKYFSTELYTLWRFDDNRAPSFKDKHLGYFQFKEYFTLGLTYNF